MKQLNSYFIRGVFRTLSNILNQSSSDRPFSKELSQTENFNPLSDNELLTTNCLTVFAHFVGLVLKELNECVFSLQHLGCGDPLGMASGEIKDYQITASTSHVDLKLKPYRARTNEDEDAWCTSVEDQKQYIQVC